MKVVFLVRHGALTPEWSGCLAGQCDASLSEEGCAQAEAIGRFLANRKIDLLLCGTLRRVRQTLDGARKFAQLPPEREDARWNELDFGDWSGMPLSTLRTENPTFADWNFGNASFTLPHGERMADFIARTRAAWNDLAETQGDTAAVFANGGALLSVLADGMGLDRKYAFRIGLSRGSVAVLQRAQNGEWRLKTMLCPLEMERNFPI